MIDATEENQQNPTRTREEVRKAFDAMHQSVSDKVSEAEKAHLIAIKEAAAAQDNEKLQGHLDRTKTESSWLYEELMKHPEVSSILRELAIMGF
jgi:hypothetical protein